jgi:hypothetical protein
VTEFAAWTVVRTGHFAKTLNSLIVGNPSTTGAATSRVRLDANAIIHGCSNPLLAAKVAFGSLYGNVPQEKLDLLQLASRCVAKPSTGPSQIVRRQLRHSDASGGFLYDVPNPCPSYFVDPAEQFSSINSRCGHPIVQLASHPIANRNRSNVASLADQINNGPMLFALLEMIQCQSHGFMPPQTAREQQCEQGSVAFSFLSGACHSAWPCSAVNQFPRRMPISAIF